MNEKKIEPMGVGVIGAGMISHTYLDTLTSKFHIVEVKAISDLNPKAAQAASEKYHIPVATNEEILSDPNIDIVLNLTPPAAHGPILSSVLNAGKHAYTEKCLAMDTQTAGPAMPASQRAGKIPGYRPGYLLFWLGPKRPEDHRLWRIGYHHQLCYGRKP